MSSTLVLLANPDPPFRDLRTKSSELIFALVRHTPDRLALEILIQRLKLELD
jgi:hypothetical protein